MTQATDVKIGDILTADSTWDDSIPSGQLFVILATDGSRMIVDKQWMSGTSLSGRMPNCLIDF